MARGIEGGNVFRKDDDKGHFLERLEKILKETETYCYAWAKGRYRKIVEARSLFCYWAVRELDETMSSLAEMFGISIPSISDSVKRGQMIANEKGFDLIKDL